MAASIARRQARLRPRSAAVPARHRHAAGLPSALKPTRQSPGNARRRGRTTADSEPALRCEQKLTCGVAPTADPAPRRADTNSSSDSSRQQRPLNACREALRRVTCFEGRGRVGGGRGRLRLWIVRPGRQRRARLLRRCGGLGTAGEEGQRQDKGSLPHRGATPYQLAAR